MRPVSATVLGEILDGGQSFRWYPTSRATWLGCWGAHVAELRIRDESLEWRAAEDQVRETRPALARYFDAAATGGWAAIHDALPWRSDRHLATAMAAFPRLRILRQPFGETLLCFLCSATKQIVQIKQMVALLAERFGEPLAPPMPADAHDGLPAGWSHQLPRWERLADVPEKDLRSCLLGFRARYIAEVARFLAARPGWLDETEALPYPEARDRLCQLPGVGEKVADCVLLFGAGRLEAFPVDVWILRTMALRYGLEAWKPSQIAHFGRMHFGAHAGVAQQFLFAWERQQRRLVRGV